MSESNDDIDAPSSDALATSDRMTRRNVARFLTAVGGAAATGSFAVDYVSGLPGELDSGTEKLYVDGTRLVDEEGNALSASDALSKDEFDEMDVFPEKEGGGALVTQRATTLLLRYPESEYEPPTNVDGTAKGYVAYSKVCTHEGCLVSGQQGSNLSCPCHGSVYNPTAGASVVDGPAPRALPQLPLGIAADSNESLIIATGPFEGAVGPEE